MRFIRTIFTLALLLLTAGSFAVAQYYHPGYNEDPREQYYRQHASPYPERRTYPDHPGARQRVPYEQGAPQSQVPQGYPDAARYRSRGYQEYGSVPSHGRNDRHGERILRDQMARAMASPETAESYYDHRLTGESQVAAVMAEADYISSILAKRNGKAFIVIDKRNFQFYLYDRSGKLLRVGPVAIGKGQTHVGAFETPVGIFPIKAKIPVDDWIRPDWYFIEEGEPIPRNWEDRRVPGFFRYKLVIEGTRYIHYAEATGGRLTHGCLGLDWEDAEAVFHTLDVGSYCIVIDRNFLQRLAGGEFPIRSAPKKKKKKDEPESRVAAEQKADTADEKQQSAEEQLETITARVQQPPEKRSAPFTNMW